MIMRGEPGCLSQMMAVYRETGGNVIAVEECDPALTNQYGIVGIGDTVGDAFRVTSMVEKPDPANAPSNYYINGRYILQPDIFRILAEQQRGAGNEIQLTDAMIRLAEIEPFFASPFRGRTYDCGSKIGFLTANVAFGLNHPELAAELKAEIKAILKMG
jgi:UTP--glucose-1-phosphate uridylyltransferase